MIDKLLKWILFLFTNAVHGNSLLSMQTGYVNHSSKALNNEHHIGGVMVRVIVCLCIHGRGEYITPTCSRVSGISGKYLTVVMVCNRV